MNAPVTRTNGHRWLAYLWLILAHGLMFGALGPALGVVVSPGVFVFPIALVVAYVTSLVPAVVTGLAVGTLALFVRERRVLYLLAMVIGVGCSVTFPFAFMPIAPSTPGLMVMYGIAGAFAALVCTRLTRCITEHHLSA